MPDTLKNLLALVAIAALALAGCDRPSDTAPSGETAPSSTTQPAGETISIAVIPKGTTHVFWKSVEAGARQAASELGVEMTWKGPLLENDRAQQIAIVEQFVGEQVDGIVLAPLDDTALRRPVESAMAGGTPVVIFDSALKGEVGKDFISFVATDNREGGRMAGRELARVLDNKGKVVLLRYQEGSASTTEREEGFLEEVGKHPDIQVIVSNRYAGPTMGDAKNASLEMVDRLQEADGIFASNESAASGMLLALRQAGLAGQKKYVAFDASETLVNGLKAGEINAMVAQNPRKMGYEAVVTIVKHLRGQPIEPRIDSGAKLITPENLNEPDIQQLLGLQQ